ncbi:MULTISPECIES: NAD(P)H-dependent oxidoreductase [Vibrio]|jgi:modulator of drug activity B|uniref:NAD(P)H-dependent oxidoreductase n=1 Tax=Vibrio TaxID=662 RepID=UPI000680A262|nr:MULTISPECIES: NAD(P)H-dependent oxidoreductase [Vibrio]AWB01332.1 flavodoxin family protein [Vibrio harveyi]EKO3802927.1 NAD(P)H-dependent oxidoreductase [Vibrio harveyi]EKO3827615.1 NAD(P)H-dependent oxidoreductase [Vibrio harveyi]MDA0133890.1 NAD(P)H-dependent oxidoreductase [Vibrio sp. NFR]QFQ81000.1 flavodoxin family protein [Vibrio harveyi]
MSNVLIINAHEPSPYSEGRLNASLVDKAQTLLQAKDHEVRVVTMQDEINVEEQLAHFEWADRVIIQSPINWMSVPWSFKKYMDDVFTAGMGGALCAFDGRSAEYPKKNYGTGGTQTNSKYMLSLTFNAPKESFDDENEYLFQGKSVDDLMLHMHANFRFFGMGALPTFACYDVMKNGDIENDFARFEAHINENF